MAVKKTPVDQPIKDIYSQAAQTQQGTTDAILRALGSTQQSTAADLTKLNAQLGGSGNALATILAVPAASANEFSNNIRQSDAIQRAALNERGAAARTGYIDTLSHETAAAQRARAAQDAAVRLAGVQANAQAAENKFRTNIERYNYEQQKLAAQSKTPSLSEWQARAMLNAAADQFNGDYDKAAAALASQDPSHAELYMGVASEFKHTDQSTLAQAAAPVWQEYFDARTKAAPGNVPFENKNFGGFHELMQFIRQKYGTDVADAISRQAYQAFDQNGQPLSSGKPQPEKSGGGGGFNWANLNPLSWGR